MKLIKWLTFQELHELNFSLQVKSKPTKQDPNLTYLTDMANGKIPLSVENMKEHITKIKQIAIELDRQHDELLNQAVEVYQKFALSVKVQ